jgi:hypothetical protein
LSQVIIANLMVEVFRKGGSDYDDAMLRHMILNSIRAIRHKFKSEYGDLIICSDDTNYWRKSAFPYYKAARKKAKEKSDIDWKRVYASISALKLDLETYFPYKFIQVENAEADDIIGTIVHNKGQFLNSGEPILIVSGDKDYFQLHDYGNVKQYDPVKKHLITTPNPERYLFEHILRGDTGDGIPNILSPDNSFVIGQRQKPITQKRVDDWDWCTDFFKGEELRGFKRNEMLIDLKQVPDHIKASILTKYEEPNTKDRSKLLNYFMKNNLKMLMESLSDF